MDIKILQSYKANERLQQLEEVQQKSALSSGFGSKREDTGLVIIQCFFFYFDEGHRSVQSLVLPLF